VTPPSHREEGELPALRIQRSRGIPALELGALWRYRDLLYFLALRDVKIRYDQTAIGVGWALLQPLFTAVVCAIFFGRVAGIPSEGVPYAAFAYAGLVPWTFFANALRDSSNSLVGHAPLVTKVYFPRLLVPGAAVAGGLVDLLLALALGLALLPICGVPLGPRLLLLVPLTALLVLLAFAVGVVLSALNVRYRDVRHAVPFLLQTWMFVTPVLFPGRLVPERWRWALHLNPCATLVEAYRATLLGHPLDVGAIVTLAAVLPILLLAGTTAFRRMERGFADVI
jgi:lipopolysaccharide transport system permease protein